MIFRYKHLVRLLDLDDEFIIDLQYYKSSNFFKKKFYSENECFLNESTAFRLIKAKNAFKREGLFVKIWDAYRPVSVQAKMRETLPDNNFVAYPPSKDNKTYKYSHMNGQCVDLTLVDKNYRNVPMPTAFDDFSEKAGLDNNPDSIEKSNALLLKDTMIECGFTPYENEWWHFYDKNEEPKEYLDFIF